MALRSFKHKNDALRRCYKFTHKVLKIMFTFAIISFSYRECERETVIQIRNERYDDDINMKYGKLMALICGEE